MSTRCAIGKVENGIVSCIYCHHDGYPEGVGSMLEEHYNSSEKVDALLDLGDLSSVHTSLEECFAYARDGGEVKKEPSKVQLDQYCKWANENFDAEYAYLWDGQSWSVALSWPEMFHKNYRWEGFKDIPSIIQHGKEVA